MSKFKVTLTNENDEVIADCWIADTEAEIAKLEIDDNETVFHYEESKTILNYTTDNFLMNEIKILKEKHKKEEEPEALNTYTPIYAIAKVIQADWKNINYAAKPYLNAMLQITNINNTYFADSGKSVVLYFLANAQTWKGETAREVKSLLKKIAGVK